MKREKVIELLNEFSIGLGDLDEKRDSAEYGEDFDKQVNALYASIADKIIALTK